ncbi:putative peptidoglycan lipid II flippase [Actinomadura pelletieri DSM 43383]|uniref:Putative peptidoglycan lipid II flippase n=1 Tax=Actinomadura pelletieri DSM 43383 TaxID=1120940 RepID=A0A495R0G3_9ACTN|nr:lipid II flippase MurJ [Actinomadura pelletieri]RKS79827.1 putative peptidoglycan lipid II flippase [Actinomadura pelletieri DSM 43383]
MTSVGRAAALSGVLIAAGTGLGFARDLTVAHLFGADGGTDAFLVAWTIPETASPLLIEDAMALLIVPVVTRLLARGDGLRPLIGTVVPRMVLGLSLVTVTLMVAAPVLVDVLAPGLTERGPAVQGVRLTAITVLTFGVAGFMSAALRAHHRFGPPAAIYLAYNVGVLALIGGLSGLVGITSIMIGVACGSFLMIAVQLPAFLRCLRATPRESLRERGTPDMVEVWMGFAAVAPAVVYTVTRQAQVFVERFFGSGLAAGSISHLNYAQKVAQVPMILSLLIVTVTFPRLARASADGDTRLVARRIQQDLVVASAMVLAATAFLVAFAPTIVRVLFEHGEFTSADTDNTASIMRVYALGLWGQSAVGLAARAFFAQRRPTWRPALVLGLGLAVTAVIGGVFVASAGTVALAAANAAGITLAAVLLLAGLRTGVAPISLRRVGVDVSRLVLAAVGACGAGAFTAALLGGGAVVELVVGGVVTGAAFVVLTVLIAPDLLIASFRRGRTESGESSEPADRTDTSDGARASDGGDPTGAAGADVPLGRPFR